MSEKLYKKQMTKINMRSKSLPLRSSRKSPSSASLPDEVNDTNHYDGDGDGDGDDEFVPFTFDERDVQLKKRHCLGTNETSGGSSEPLNLDACFVCGIFDKWISRCLGVGCFISFHGECLDAKFDGGEDVANKYCPYCWFKIVAEKCMLARENALDAEKAVCKYLDIQMTYTDTTISDDENENREHSEASIVISDKEIKLEKDTSYSSKVEQVKVERDSGKPRSEKLPTNEETDHPKERVAIENFQDVKDDETTNDQTKVNTCAGGKSNVSQFLSMQESFSGKEYNEVQQKETLKRRRRRQVVVDSEISSNESTNERYGEDVTEKITSSAQVTFPSGKTESQQRSKFNADKGKTVRDIWFFNKDQRKKLLWTSEEEEMLKVGVERYASEANKNIPWRKILEMGDKVFQETRMPADLKDKWRKMIKMEKTTTH